MSKLIIICGFPGSGKTTLTKELSKELGIFCLEKDFIKEGIYESFNCSGLADSKKVGKATIELLFKLSEEAFRNKVDIILEGVFSFKEDAELFKRWEIKYNLDLYTIVCSIDEKKRIERFTSRKDRHKAHCDEERLKDPNNNYIPNNFDYNVMPGKKIKVITDRPADELVEEVKKELS